MRRLILLFTLVFLALLVFDLYPGLRGGAGWRWPYALPENAAGLLVLAAALVVYLLGVFLLRRTAQAWPSLLWACCGAALISVAVVGVRGDAGFLLFTRAVSPVQTGASALAVRVMAADGLQPTLENWPTVMRAALDANLIHFTTSPPGQPLLHHALAGAFDSLPGLSRPLSLALRPYQCADLQVMRYTRGEIVSAGVGMLMPLWAALAVFPLHWAASSLQPSARLTAARAVVWWPLIPTLSLFAPTWNTLYPGLAVLSFALLMAGLLRRGSRSAFGCMGAGVVMSAATFLNFAVLPLLLLFGLFTLGVCLVPLPGALLNGLRRALIAGVWFGAGLLSVWALFFLAAGHTPLDLLRVTFDKHAALVQRDELPWLLLHPYDTLLFMGWPLALLFLIGAGRGVMAFRRQRGLHTDPHLALVLATLATFIALNLSGIVQGENGRILSFYAPFFLLGAVGFVQETGRSPGWDVPLLGAQALTVLVMAAALPVVPLDLNPQPTAPRQDVPSFDFLAQRPLEATFSSPAYAGTLRLDSYRFIADVAQQAISLETHWRGLAPTERPYAFEIVASARNAIDGQIITPPYRWYPQSGNYLTTCWRAGDVVRDVTVLPLPTISAPVTWTLTLRAVDERTGDVLRITLPDGTQRDHLALGPVNYP